MKQNSINKHLDMNFPLSEYLTKFLEGLDIRDLFSLQDSGIAQRGTPYGDKVYQLIEEA